MISKCMAEARELYIAGFASSLFRSLVLVDYNVAGEAGSSDRAVDLLGSVSGSCASLTCSSVLAVLSTAIGFAVAGSCSSVACYVLVGYELMLG
jgi:hypothetical protein